MKLQVEIYLEQRAIVEIEVEGDEIPSQDVLMKKAHEEMDATLGACWESTSSWIDSVRTIND